MNQYKPYEDRFLETTILYAKDKSIYFDSAHKKMVPGKVLQKALDSHTVIIQYGEEYLKPLFWGLDEDDQLGVLLQSVNEAKAVKVSSPMEYDDNLRENVESLYSNYRERFSYSPVLYAKDTTIEGEPSKQSGDIMSLVLFTDPELTTKLSASKIFEFFRRGGLITYNGSIFINPVGYTVTSNGEMKLYLATSSSIEAAIIKNDSYPAESESYEIPIDYRLYAERYEQSVLYIVKTESEDMIVAEDPEGKKPVSTKDVYRLLLKRVIVLLSNEKSYSPFEPLAFIDQSSGDDPLSMLLIGFPTGVNMQPVPIKIM